MGRIAIFIDGGYLDAVLRDEFRGARIDYALLAEEIARGHDLLRTYYYNCLPYQSNPPTTEESRRFGAARKFHEALNALPDFEVRLGRLARRGVNPDGSAHFEQKQVDLLLGIDLTLLSGKHLITHGALVTGDSDLVPAVEVAKREGVSVLVYHGRTYHQELWSMADRRVQITQELIERIRRTQP